jgi:Fungal chitosanase of glycosyl hydrolase group 75
MTAEVIVIDQLGETKVRRFSDDSSIFFFRAGLAIDADGAPHAYHPDDDPGLDYLENAGHPGDWWALVTDTGEPDGAPIIQGSHDPAPGFYISMTTLEDQSKKRTDPKHYVDAEAIPFFVLPGNKKFGTKLGDFGFVVNSANGKSCGCVFADTGPVDELGEGSIALAKALGVDASPKDGGVDDGLAYVVFPSSGPGWPSSTDEIQKKATKLFKDWGGMAKIKQGLPRLKW